MFAGYSWRGGGDLEYARRRRRRSSRSFGQKCCPKEARAWSALGSRALLKTPLQLRFRSPFPFRPPSPMSVIIPRRLSHGYPTASDRVPPRNDSVVVFVPIAAGGGPRNRSRGDEDDLSAAIFDKRIPVLQGGPRSIGTIFSRNISDEEKLPLFLAPTRIIPKTSRPLDTSCDTRQR